MGVLGSIAEAAISIANPVAGLTIRTMRGFLALARRNWKEALGLAAALIVVVGFFILRGEVRHRDKIIADQAKTIAAVKGEVDRGVGKPTHAADAPIYIRGFVDNLRTVQAALN